LWWSQHVYSEKATAKERKRENNTKKTYQNHMNAAIYIAAAEKTIIVINTHIYIYNGNRIAIKCLYS